MSVTGKMAMNVPDDREPPGQVGLLGSSCTIFEPVKRNLMSFGNVLPLLDIDHAFVDRDLLDLPASGMR